MIENELGLEIDTDKYEKADQYLAKFASKLADYPPIRSIEPEGEFRDYLGKIGTVIEKLFPLQYQQLGVSEVADQIEELREARLPHQLESLDIFHDCKLNAAVTGYLIQELASRNGWPITPELMLRPQITHAYTALHLDDRVYVIHYGTDTREAIKNISDYDEATYQQMIATNRISSSEPDLRQGLIDFDLRYRIAVTDAQHRE